MKPGLTASVNTSYPAEASPVLLVCRAPYTAGPLTALMGLLYRCTAVPVGEPRHRVRKLLQGAHLLSGGAGTVVDQAAGSDPCRLQGESPLLETHEARWWDLGQDGRHT